jgi:hypothetical protein
MNNFDIDLNSDDFLTGEEFLEFEFESLNLFDNPEDFNLEDF